MLFILFILLYTFFVMLCYVMLQMLCHFYYVVFCHATLCYVMSSQFRCLMSALKLYVCSDKQYDWYVIAILFFSWTWSICYIVQYHISSILCEYLEPDQSFDANDHIVISAWFYSRGILFLCYVMMRYDMICCDLTSLPPLLLFLQVREYCCVPWGTVLTVRCYGQSRTSKITTRCTW